MRSKNCWIAAAISVALIPLIGACSLLDSGSSQPLLQAPEPEPEQTGGGISLNGLLDQFLPGNGSTQTDATTQSLSQSSGQAGAAAAIGPSAIGGTPNNTPTGAVYSGDFSRFGPGPNVHLWRSSLEVLSFMPMALADPVTGLIQTNWHQAPGNAAERLRAEVYILSDQLREDSLRVNVYRQSGNPATGQWVNATVNPSTARQLEHRILERAKERQISAGQGR